MRLKPFLFAMGLVGLGLAGCDEQAPPAGLPPLELEAAATALQQQHPDAVSFDVLDDRGKGFRFLSTGEVEYVAFGAQTDLRHRTTVTERSGNRVCVAPVKTWTGACLEFYGRAEGPLTVVVTFGNGATRSYETAVRVQS